MSTQIFTADELQDRFRSNRNVTARLFANPDYQEWLTRVLRPKLVALQTEVMSSDLLTEEGRSRAITNQISYTALSTFLESDLRAAGVNEEMYQKSLLITKKVV